MDPHKAIRRISTICRELGLGPFYKIEIDEWRLFKICDGICAAYKKLQAENEHLKERVKELEMLNWLIVDDLGEIFISDANKARVRKNPKIVCTRDEKLKGIFLRTEEEKP